MASSLCVGAAFPLRLRVSVFQRDYTRALTLARLWFSELLLLRSSAQQDSAAHGQRARHGAEHRRCTRGLSFARGCWDSGRADFVHGVPYMKKEGSIEWYNQKRGFGFITCADSVGRIFFHVSQIRTEGRKEDLRPNERVTFDVLRGPKGPQAVNVFCSESGKKEN